MAYGHILSLSNSHKGKISYGQIRQTRQLIKNTSLLRRFHFRKKKKYGPMILSDSKSHQTVHLSGCSSRWWSSLGFFLAYILLFCLLENLIKCKLACSLWNCYWSRGVCPAFLLQLLYYLLQLDFVGKNVQCLQNSLNRTTW